MATSKGLAEQTGAYSQQTATPYSEHHSLIQLRGNATYQARRTAQVLKVITGCAWISFDGKDWIVRSGEEITLNPGLDAAVISRLSDSVLVFSMLD
jgi:hypothetical protein